MRRLLADFGWPMYLLPFIPLALALKFADASAGLIFFTSAIGVIPTAATMGKATEELAERAGPGIGGILNVTFGNAPEIIIALFALHKGLHEVVKASLIGSILGNILLVMGAAMLVGGLHQDRRGGRQTFDPTAASAQSSLLLLVAAALLMPAILELSGGHGLPHAGDEVVDYPSHVEHLSLWIAGILMATYVAALVFTLRTHRALFNPETDDADGRSDSWTVRRAVIWLAIAGVLVGVMSEVLVGSIHDAAESVGLSEFFIGAIVVAIVGNAAEHWVAVLVAWKDKMDLAVNIAIGSSAQIAMFAIPLLVFASYVIGPHPMALVFNGFELGAIFLAVIIANHVAGDGESTWFEGLQLLAVYFVLGVAFFFA
jgi:Ca2+:H+ antiporter